MSNINIGEKDEVYSRSNSTQTLQTLTDWKLLASHLRHLFYQIRTLKQKKIGVLLQKCVKSKYRTKCHSLGFQ